MILVTGAAGKTGRAAIQAIAARGESVRALVHRSVQVAPIKALGAQEVVVGDMGTVSDVARAVQGVRQVYHICPNLSPNEVRFGDLMIAEARRAGVEHFVYHSILHPKTESIPSYWQKMRVEERLAQSSVTYSLLQPAAYMQNILPNWERITETGIYEVPYAVDTSISLVDLADVAEAAAVVLTRREYAGRTYELAGPESLTPRKMATILSEQLGRPVQAQALSPLAWEHQARQMGLDEYQVQAFQEIYHHYEQFGFNGDPNGLMNLLGRTPTSFADFAKRVKAK